MIWSARRPRQLAVGFATAGCLSGLMACSHHTSGVKATPGTTSSPSTSTSIIATNQLVSSAAEIRAGWTTVATNESLTPDQAASAEAQPDSAQVMRADGLTRAQNVIWTVPRTKLCAASVFDFSTQAGAAAFYNRAISNQAPADATAESIAIDGVPSTDYSGTSARVSGQLTARVAVKIGHFEFQVSLLGDASDYYDLLAQVQHFVDAEYQALTGH